MAKKKKKKEKEISKDWSLINQINNHIHVFGFASAVDNLVVACEDKIEQWKERFEKAKKIREMLGDNFGRN